MKVFISYSHDSEEHRRRVLDLANRLRLDRVDAWIDRYTPSPLEGWPRWMQARIEEADLVLVFCTETYCRRFEGREAVGIGRGVTFEGLLISQILYEESMRNRKFVPVLSDGDAETVVPLMLRPYASYRYPAQYSDLYSRVTGRPEVLPPPLGGVMAEPAEALEPLEIPDSLFEGAPASGLIRFRVLVVDDVPVWRRRLKWALEGIGPDTLVDRAASFPAALALVQTHRYDLAVVDRALLGEPSEQRQPDDLGIDLLAEIRRSPLNESCAVIVITGYPHAHVYKRAYRDQGAYDVLGKTDYDSTAFLATARDAIRAARLAGAVADLRPCLTVSFNEERLLHARLSGPKESTHPVDLAFEGYRLAERLDAAVQTPAADGEIESVGLDLYGNVSRDERLFEPLMVAEVLAEPSENMVLQWSGPASGLGVPFELLTEGDHRELWCLRHVLTRHVSIADHTSHKTETFAQLIERLQEEKAPLRILLVSGGGDHAAACDREIEELAATIGKDLAEIALPRKIDILRSSKVFLPLLRQVIRDGNPHILHYAGPGRRGDTLPEGVTLRQTTLTAEDLTRLVENTNLHLVVLNGCLGLHGTGRFSAVYETLVRADIPAILSHRWPVSDETGLLLASAFYRELWRTFSPGDALLAARRACAATTVGNDYAWASPVLVLQNE